MKKTALVIMAAGIGSRFGNGIKQLAPVGPHGEIIMDYSVHDAIEAGFDKVIFIIRKDIEEEFRRGIGSRMGNRIETAYAFQELTDLPAGFTVPEGRTKPWGTGHAVLCARDLIKEPFAVINADDYYGKQAYQLLHRRLTEQEEIPGEPMRICMAGFRLKNTLSEHGSVTRGLCEVTDGQLTKVTETREIYKTPEGAESHSDGQRIALDPERLVSMNMWGLTPEFVQTLSAGFEDFLAGIPEGNLKAEYLLPEIIDGMLRRKQLQVDVLESSDTWFGMTYQEDRAAVTEALAQLTKQGVYPDGLYR